MPFLPGTKRVILFAYMKGGSTFLGQLFNQNEAATYWYEPIAAMYSALYGSPDWAFPQEVLFTKEAKFRYRGQHAHKLSVSQ